MHAYPVSELMIFIQLMTGRLSRHHRYVSNVSLEEKNRNYFMLISWIVDRVHAYTHAYTRARVHIHIERIVVNNYILFIK